MHLAYYDAVWAAIIASLLVYSYHKGRSSRAEELNLCSCCGRHTAAIDGMCLDCYVEMLERSIGDPD